MTEQTRVQMNTEAITTAINTLADRTDAAKADATFRAYLKSAASFHTYSFTNQMLIAIQRPAATHVAGFHAWKTNKRAVKKGAKGIHIMAPMTKVVEDKTTGEMRARTFGFKSVCVFDILDTEGQELPACPSYRSEAGSLELMEKLLNAAERLGFTVKQASDLGGAKGTSLRNDIELLDTLTTAESIGTLVHEMAHSVLHWGDNRSSLTKEQKELEAEATSFAVLTHYGIDQPSHFYLGAWDATGDTIRASLATITKAVTTILSAADYRAKRTEAA